MLPHLSLSVRPDSNALLGRALLSPTQQKGANLDCLLEGESLLRCARSRIIYGPEQGIAIVACNAAKILLGNTAIRVAEMREEVAEFAFWKRG